MATIKWRHSAPCMYCSLLLLILSARLVLHLSSCELRDSPLPQLLIKNKKKQLTSTTQQYHHNRLIKWQLKVQLTGKQHDKHERRSGGGGFIRFGCSVITAQ